MTDWSSGKKQRKRSLRRVIKAAVAPMRPAAAEEDEDEEDKAVDVVGDRDDEEEDEDEGDERDEEDENEEDEEDEAPLKSPKKEGRRAASQVAKLTGADARLVALAQRQKAARDRHRARRAPASPAAAGSPRKALLAYRESIGPRATADERLVAFAAAMKGCGRVAATGGLKGADARLVEFAERRKAERERGRGR